MKVNTKPNPSSKELMIAKMILMIIFGLFLLFSTTKNNPTKIKPKDRLSALAYPSGRFKAASSPSPDTSTGGIKEAI